MFKNRNRNVVTDLQLIHRTMLRVIGKIITFRNLPIIIGIVIRTSVQRIFLLLTAITARRGVMCL